MSPTRLDAGAYLVPYLPVTPTSTEYRQHLSRCSISVELQSDSLFVRFVMVSDVK